MGKGKKYKEKYYFLIEGEVENYDYDSDVLEEPKVIRGLLKAGVDIGETFGMTLGEFKTRIKKFKFQKVRKNKSGGHKR